MKYEGAVRGVADLILLIPKKGWASLCIEMKTPKGTQSEHQRTWQTEAERYQNKYVICHSLQEFINRSKFLPTMTYIDYVNQFWKTHQSVAFSSNEVYLYFFLLNECNSRGWENPFECPNRRIVLATGISEPTVIEVRNRLQQKGLLQFESGKKNAKSPVYYLNDLSKPLSKLLSNDLSKPLSKRLTLI